MALKLNLKKDELISVAVEMEKSKQEAEKNEREAETQLEKIKLSQIEKQLELEKVRKESEKNSQSLESGEPSSITDKLESLVKSIKTLTIQVPVRLKECRSEKNCFCLRPHNSLIHFSRDKTRNPTPTSNLNLDAPTFVPGQIEGSVEANSQSQFVANVDIDQAETKLIRMVQEQVFLAEIKSLQSKGVVSPNSANKELKRFLKLIEDSDGNLTGFLSAEGTEWKFIPPRAPSFGVVFGKLRLSQ
ncbi:hypothetical protein TNCV_3617281 [Trichonephila clavipes]|nr:hypothetical protein TNCV_3617281 [Trichonephila clavipes]